MKQYASAPQRNSLNNAYNILRYDKLLKKDEPCIFPDTAIKKFGDNQIGVEEGSNSNSITNLSKDSK